MIRIGGTKMHKTSVPFDDLYLKDIYNRLQLLPEDGISDNLRILKQSFISFMNTNSLFYKPDICLFTNNLNLKNKEDIPFE
jgi:hypothetical protein